MVFKRRGALTIIGFLTAVVAASVVILFARTVDIVPRPVEILEPQAAEEARVLAAALAYLGETVRVLTVHDTLVGPTAFQHADSLAQTLAYWQRDYPELPLPSAALGEAFRLANLTRIPTGARLRLPGRYIAEGATLAPFRRFAWHAVYTSAGQSHDYHGGRVFLSRAGIDPTGQRALVAVELSCSSLCGFGQLLSLRRSGFTWIVEGAVLLWIA